MTPKTQTPLKITIIGGGAAGFFAAITAAEADPSAEVTVYEKGNAFLTKVKISGGGRCNVTHACFDPAILSKNYPRGSRELRGAFHEWQPRDTVAWFEARGVELKAESDGRMFPVTEVLANILVGMGVKRERIRVIPNGINPKNFAQVPSTEEAKAAQGVQGRMVIGFIGFVREWDRLDRIVNWLAQRPADDPAMLLIVGDGEERPKLEQQAKALGIAHKLKFTGVVARSQVPAAAASFDIALQTALVPYASPLCLFEYMALGKAILAPDQPNHHEVLVGGVDADMYDPDDNASIEKRLDVLAADAELRARLGSAAKKALLDRQYVWAGNARRVAEVAAQVRAAGTSAA